MTLAFVLAVWLSAGAVWVAGRPPPDSLVRRRLGRPDGSQPVPVAGRRPALATARRRGTRVARANRAAVVELCMAVADELRVGRLPADALLAVAAVTDGCPVGNAVVAARTGQPVAPALFRDAAAHPGADGLRLVAACWQVAEQHGAGLAVAVDRVADALRAEELARHRVVVELAAPKATAKLLAGLPALGLLLGTVMGANPIRVLVAGWGWGLFAAGIALDLAGLAWVGRIARAAEQSG